jgi:hypothetical protein
VFSEDRKDEEYDEGAPCMTQRAPSIANSCGIHPKPDIINVWNVCFKIIKVNNNFFRIIEMRA